MGDPPGFDSHKPATARHDQGAKGMPAKTNFTSKITMGAAAAVVAVAAVVLTSIAVSYTHLTLPTILLV